MGVKKKKLKALQTIQHNGKEIAFGEEFKIEDKYAERLIEIKAALFLEEEQEEGGAEK